MEHWLAGNVAKERIEERIELPDEIIGILTMIKLKHETIVRTGVKKCAGRLPRTREKGTALFPSTPVTRRTTLAPRLRIPAERSL
jgi:hypothetical protein